MFSGGIGSAMKRRYDRRFTGRTLAGESQRRGEQTVADALRKSRLAIDFPFFGAKFLF
jgi:hypothetical protein